MHFRDRAKAKAKPAAKFNLEKTIYLNFSTIITSPCLAHFTCLKKNQNPPQIEMKCSTITRPSNGVFMVNFAIFMYFLAHHLAAADLLDFSVQTVHHIWQLQAFWPTC